MPLNPDLLVALGSLVADANTDLDLEGACRAAATALGVDGVGVTLSLPGTLRAVVAGSNDTARDLEQAQLTAAEGPCTLASWTGKPVHTPDLTDFTETRWPMLVLNLADLPVRAVTAVPLTLGAAASRLALGSLGVFSTHRNGLDGLDLDAIATMIGAAVLRMPGKDLTSAAFDAITREESIRPPAWSSPRST